MNIIDCGIHKILLLLMIMIILFAGQVRKLKRGYECN